MNASHILDKILIYSGLNIRSLSIKLGFEKPQALYDIHKGKTKSISSQMVFKITSVFPEINKSWLLTGEGDMLNDSGSVSEVITPYNLGKSKEIETQEESEIIYTTTLLPMKVMGGSLAMAAEYASSHDCEKIPSPIGKVDFAITISGESMYPEYPNGSQVLLKKVNERAFIEWGSTYVLDTCNGPIIKRLEPSDKGDDYVKCVSINPEYSPFDVGLEYVYGIYRVLMCLSRK